MTIARFVFLNAENAENPQNTQTGWECGDDANCVGYATDKVGS